MFEPAGELVLVPLDAPQPHYVDLFPFTLATVLHFAGNHSFLLVIAGQIISEADTVGEKGWGDGLSFEEAIQG